MIVKDLSYDIYKHIYKLNLWLIITLIKKWEKYIS